MKAVRSLSSLIALFAIGILIFSCEEEKKNDPIPPDDRFGTFIDSRDNQEYSTVQIGTQKWMAENLNWAGKGICYDEDSLNCEKYGRLYSILEVFNGESPVEESIETGVQGICPDGWHVPSMLEWNKLLVFLGADSAEVASALFGVVGVNAAVGNKLKADAEWSFPSGKQFVNSSGFGALPSGWMTRDTVNNTFNFINLGGDALIFSSSFNDSTKLKIRYRTLKDDLSGSSELGIRSGRAAIDNNTYLACRCIED